MAYDPQLEARLHGTIDHAGGWTRERLDEVPTEFEAAGPGGLAGLVRDRPVLLLAAAAVASFLVARLVKRAVRSRTGGGA